MFSTFFDESAFTSTILYTFSSPVRIDACNFAVITK